MTVSTHVLDTGRGVPAAGVPVSLERSDGTEWTTVGGGTTDVDGRAGGWATPEAGVHRLRFTVDGPFFPEVTVVFRVAEPDGRLHIPLLLSPYGYSTYRGS